MTTVPANSPLSLRNFAEHWAAFVVRRAMVIVLAAILITYLAVQAAQSIAVSTRLEELMPANARSVQTLENVLTKTGSFASIQIVVESESADETLAFLIEAKKRIDQLDWVDFSQFSEDIEILVQHKLLMTETEELLELENEVEATLPIYLARKLSEAVGTDVSYRLRDSDIVATSDQELNQGRIDSLTASLNEPLEKVRLFTTNDGKTGVLIAWPKTGNEGLASSKQMVLQAGEIAAALQDLSSGSLRAGVAGRIANKVAQFDAVSRDLKYGLLTAITLIMLLIGGSFRSVIAAPIIIGPLAIGIAWTLGVTALVIGGLNLITVFLVLILFGLGIDFGIHNFSRFQEERRRGASIDDAIHAVITQTGHASLIAALTTASGFYALLLTQFRAFSEFGFIAGTGILLIFIAMYSLFPAILVLMCRLRPNLNWARSASAPGDPARYDLTQTFAHKHALLITVALFVFSALFVLRVQFESNFNNLEARQPADLQWANAQTDIVFGDGHDRAIVSVDTFNELRAVKTYFDEKIASDTLTPTIEKTVSVLNFVPPTDVQRSRLEIIERLNIRADEIKYIDTERYEAAKQYLAIDQLELDDLPEALRRNYLGADNEPGYLLYIYNSVSMDDARDARNFYDDAAVFDVDGQSYASASEGFIFVEMIALMKADAAKAIMLVALATGIFVFGFTRNFWATAVILIPPILGVFVTLGVMGLIGLKLSIMNMVILPSLIGITVDNAIHIFHRFESERSTAKISAIMNTTGRAAVLTTMTTLIGFGGLIIASMGGLRSMGLLAIIGFTACLVITWILLPGLLRLYGHRHFTHENTVAR